MNEKTITAEIKEAGQFRYQAELSTGEVLMADDLMALAAMLVLAGVTIENAFCGDWREPGYIGGGSAISFKVEMRRLSGDMNLEF